MSTAYSFEDVLQIIKNEIKDFDLYSENKGKIEKLDQESIDTIAHDIAININEYLQ